MKRSVALAVLALAIAGCSGGGDNGAPLAWQEPPRLITTPTHARVLIGRVTNGSGDELVLKAAGLSECPHCHEPKPPHRVCPNCGYYRGRQARAVEEE